MHKIFALAATLCVTLLTACQTLPEGSRRPELKIKHAALTVENNIPGFKLECSLMHDSQQSLPLLKEDVTVFINGTKAGSLSQSIPDKVLPPHQELTLSYFVPAQLPPAAAYSLRYNRMLKLPTSILVHLTFAEGKDELHFNPNATYEGLISRD